LVVADGHHLNDALAMLNAISPDWRCINPTEISISQPLLPEAQAFFTATQANFCAACLPGVREGHEDAAPLMVLARILSQQYLHPVLREQGGAYGGGASFDQTTGLFRFYSFRDPELNKTLDTFRRAGQWVRSNPITPVEVEESVLSIVSGIDAPGSPAGEARTAHHQGLQGRSEETRRRFRQAILEVTPEAVMRASETYLHQTPSVAVVTSAKHQSQLSGDFVCEQLA
jgi:Zn-dependent M16 (insulinase) family peptidase